MRAPVKLGKAVVANAPFGGANIDRRQEWITAVDWEARAVRVDGAPLHAVGGVKTRRDALVDVGAVVRRETISVLHAAADRGLANRGSVRLWNAVVVRAADG